MHHCTHACIPAYKRHRVLSKHWLKSTTMVTSNHGRAHAGQYSA